MSAIPTDIRPGLAPDSVVIRFYASESGRLLLEHRLPPGPVYGQAELSIRPGDGPPMVVVYDGDDGEALALGIAITVDLAEILDGVMYWSPRHVN